MIKKEGLSSLSKYVGYLLKKEALYHMIGMGLVALSMVLLCYWKAYSIIDVITITVLTPAVYGYHIIFNGLLSSGATKRLSIMLICEGVSSIVLVFFVLSTIPTVVGLAVALALKWVTSTIVGASLVCREFELQQHENKKRINFQTVTSIPHQKNKSNN